MHITFFCARSAVLSASYQDADYTNALTKSMIRTLDERRTLPRRRSTFSEINEYFGMRIRRTENNYEALEERLAQVEDFVTAYEDRFEISLRDLNEMDYNVDKLKDQIEILKSNIRELDSCVYRVHDRVFDLKKSLDNKAEEIKQSFEYRLELIETVFNSLQKRKFINSEIELVPIETKRSRNESDTESSS